MHMCRRSSLAFAHSCAALAGLESKTQACGRACMHGGAISKRGARTPAPHAPQTAAAAHIMHGLPCPSHPRHICIHPSINPQIHVSSHLSGGAACMAWLQPSWDAPVSDERLPVPPASATKRWTEQDLARGKPFSDPGPYVWITPDEDRMVREGVCRMPCGPARACQPAGPGSRRACVRLPPALRCKHHAPNAQMAHKCIYALHYAMTAWASVWGRAEARSRLHACMHACVGMACGRAWWCMQPRIMRTMCTVMPCHCTAP